MKVRLKDLPPMIGTRTAAQIVGMHPNAVALQCREGTFIVPAVKIGKNWRIPTKKLLRAVGLDDDARG